MVFIISFDVLYFFVNNRLIHSVTKSLSEHADKIDATLKGEVEAAINDAKNLKEGASVEELKAKVSDLSNASMKIGQAMYSSGKKDGENGDGNSSTTTDSTADAKEAEYENKKTDEKK